MLNFGNSSLANILTTIITQIKEIFAEQVRWAASAGVDFMIAETFGFLEEAVLALRVIKEVSGLPAVVTLVIHQNDLTRDGYTPEDACLALEVDNTLLSHWNGVFLTYLLHNREQGPMW